MAEEILPMSAVVSSGSEGVERGEREGEKQRVTLAVVEVAQHVTRQNAQQWHRAVGR